MIGRSNRRLLQLFKDRFEEDGSSYLFRPKLTAPAVRVTRAEFEEAIEHFRRAIRWQFIGLVGALITIAVTAAVVDTGLHRKTSDWEIWSLTLLVLTGFMLRGYMLWTAPAREFGGRRDAGPALTRAEARNAALRRMSWSRFGFSGLAVLVIVGGRALDLRLAWPWRIAAGVFVLGFLVLLAVRAYQKWRLARPT